MEEEKLLTFQPLITSLQLLQALAKEDKTDNNNSKQIIPSNKPGVSTPSRLHFLGSIPAPRTIYTS